MYRATPTADGESRPSPALNVFGPATTSILAPDTSAPPTAWPGLDRDRERDLTGLERRAEAEGELARVV